MAKTLTKSRRPSTLGLLLLAGLGLALKGCSEHSSARAEAPVAPSPAAAAGPFDARAKVAMRKRLLENNDYFGVMVCNGARSCYSHRSVRFFEDGTFVQYFDGISETDERPGVTEWTYRLTGPDKIFLKPNEGPNKGYEVALSSDGTIQFEDVFLEAKHPQATFELKKHLPAKLRSKP